MIKLLNFLYFIIKEIVNPIVYVLIHIYKFIFSFIKLLFYLPTLSLMKLGGFVKELGIGIWLLFKSLFAGLNFFKSFIVPAAKTTIENKEVTFNII